MVAVVVVVVVVVAGGGGGGAVVVVGHRPTWRPCVSYGGSYNLI